MCHGGGVSTPVWNLSPRGLPAGQQKAEWTTSSSLPPPTRTLSIPHANAFLSLLFEQSRLVNLLVGDTDMNNTALLLWNTVVYINVSISICSLSTKSQNHIVIQYPNTLDLILFGWKTSRIQNTPRLQRWKSQRLRSILHSYRMTTVRETPPSNQCRNQSNMFT